MGLERLKFMSSRVMLKCPWKVCGLFTASWLPVVGVETVNFHKFGTFGFQQSEHLLYYSSFHLNGLFILLHAHPPLCLMLAKLCVRSTAAFIFQRRLSPVGLWWIWPLEDSLLLWPCCVVLVQILEMCKMEKCLADSDLINVLCGNKLNTCASKLMFSYCFTYEIDVFHFYWTWGLG